MDSIKKIILYGSILICLFLGGCSGEAQREKEWIPTSPVSLAKPEEIEDLFSGEVTPIDFVYPDESADGKIYEISEKRVVIDGKVFWEENDSVYVRIGELSSLMPNMSVEYEETTCVISCPTYFFDENALLCVQVKCIFHENGASEIVKSYYYTNGNLYNVKSTSDSCVLKQTEDVYVPLELIANLYGFDFTYDSKTHSFIISGGKTSCENVNNTVYIPIYPKVSGGHVWTSAGTYRPSNEVVDATQKNNFSSTSLENAIPVTGGEKLKVTCYSSWIPEVATMVFMNDANEVISLLTTSKSTYLKDSVITVPEKATKLLLSLYTNQDYAFYREGSFNGADLSKVDKDEYYDTMYAILRENREKSIENNTYSNSFRKGYISFVIDDLRPDIDKVVNIFEEHNIPVCIAAPNMMLYSCSQGEKSRYEVCIQAVQNGGEILAHNGMVITNENADDADIMFEQFFERWYYLKEYGFEVNGIITSGGTNYLNGDPRTDLFARTYYQYSDLYGEKAYGEPFYHPRTWVTHILDSYEKFIQQTVNTKTWRVIYFHGLNEISEEQLRAILSTVKSYDVSQLEAVNYSQIYNMME